MKYSITALSAISAYILSVGFVAGIEHEVTRPFGDLATARTRFPEFFAPGVVTPAEISATPSYLICATASRDFPDEKDSELLSNLELTAKNALLMYLTNGKPEGMMLEITGMRILYSWGDNDSLSANFGMPITGVKLHRKPEQQPEPPAGAQDGGAKLSELTEKDPIVPPAPFQGSDGTAKTSEVEEGVSALVDHFTTMKLTELADALQSLVADSNPSLPEALKMYRQLQRNSVDADALQALGKLYEGNGSIAHALAHYNMALKILESKSPEQAESMSYKIAVLTEKAKEASEALDCYNDFLRRYPASKHTPTVLKRISKLRSNASIRIDPAKQ